MNKLFITLTSLTLLLSMSAVSQAQQAQGQYAIEAAQAECVIKAKENNIPEDQYVDYVGACMEKIISSIQ